MTARRSRSLLEIVLVTSLGISQVGVGQRIAGKREG
jgi:hypothetical protein